jgi:hypothetical protein
LGGWKIRRRVGQHELSCPRMFAISNPLPSLPH